MNALIKHYPAEKGFSLIELLIGLSIATLLITLSVPMSNLLHANKATTQIHEFASSLNFARSEAIKRGNFVTVCRTLGNTKCEGPRDIGGQKVWDAGWMVFSDINGNGQFNGAEDQVLHQHGPLPANYSLRSNARVRITYKAIGMSPGFMDTWTLCGPNGNPELTRGVILAYSGRVRFAQDNNRNGIRDNGTSNNGTSNNGTSDNNRNATELNCDA